MKNEKDHITHKNKDPFQAPEGYFDTLADRITDRIKDEKKGKQVFLPIHMAMAVAAVITLAVSVWIIMAPAQEGPSSAELIAELSDEEIIDYLISADISLEEIYETADFNASDADSLQLEIMPEIDMSTDDIDDLIEFYDLEEFENS
jgi:hypothetical protein